MRQLLMVVRQSSVVCVCLAFVLFGCQSDRRESYYASLADADKAGAVTHGWIPDDLLPRSSHAIHEVHEISPSTEWCAFEFVPNDTQNLHKNLKTFDALPPSVRRVPDPRVSWWPAALEGSLDPVKIHSAGFELYIVEVPATSVTRDVLLFAIDWSKGGGFFYRTAKNGASG